LLQFNSISLTQFKNYQQRVFRFNSRIVGISGPNGVGKTNLLDAIYYLSFTKSYFSRSDAASVQSGSTGFRIEGEATLHGERCKLVCILRESGKKEFLLNDSAYDRLSRHVGRFPTVFIAPDDVRMITEGSDERRRYIDAMLSQLDAEYLQRLMNYNRILLQRNSHLKAMWERRSHDYSLLEVYDTQLVTDGTYIFERRTSFLRECLPAVVGFYGNISGGEERIALHYDSQLAGRDYRSLLTEQRQKDLQLQRTSTGIHKDDIEISLNDQPFKAIASQGQRKSLLFALKLAEFDVLKRHKGFAPVLLLDDVFEKLDADRMHNLLEWVCVSNGGQIFITDTHKERIAAHLHALGVEFQEVEA